MITIKAVALHPVELIQLLPDNRCVTERPPLFDYDNEAHSFNVRLYQDWLNFYAISKRNLERDRRSLEEAKAMDYQVEHWKKLVEDDEWMMKDAAREIERARRYIAQHLGFDYVPKFFS